MRIPIITLAALNFCAPAWSQPSPKPEIDWATIESQSAVLQSAIQARDIIRTQKASQQLWHTTTDKMVSESPSAADRLALAESKRRTENTDLLLPYLAMLAFQAGQLDKAQLYANQTLQAPSTAYDSIHTGNIVLGLVALNRDGDVRAASSYLLSAVKTKGSPSLDRWGPNLALAKALLEKGQNEAVLEYFQSCKSFVTKNPKLDDWIAMLKGGGSPDFSHEFLWFQ